LRYPQYERSWPNIHGKSRRRRLRRELEVIGGAIEAARILGEALATDQLGPDRDHQRAPRALTSLLTLVERQLRDVCRRRLRSIESRRAAPPEETPAETPGGRLAQRTFDDRIRAQIAMRQRAGGTAWPGARTSTSTDLYIYR
jgi:hypothetical protein